LNAGLILAGGIGARVKGYDSPKQYIEVGGKTIISYVLDVFNKSPYIDIICIIANIQWHSLIGDYIFAEPGVSRQHSIYNGLRTLQQYSPKWVVIHDSARPCITAGDIGCLIKSAEEYDGATPTLPVNETIYYSFNGKTIASTLARDQIFVGQTPECYDFEKYLAAHEQFYEMLGEFRGSSTIAVNAGMKIARADGNIGNFKITTNADLERFREIIEKSGEL
jgi:2-C-methyl-D-erythritol 4-phosphate cytidylyltransferase